MTYSLEWLAELADAAPTVPQVPPPRVYYSQRRMATQATLEESLQEIVCRTRLLVLELQEEGFFAETFGFSCIDDLTPVGKPNHTYSAEMWSPTPFKCGTLCEPFSKAQVRGGS